MPAVNYRQLRRQEQDDEIALTNYEVREGSCHERSELLEEETDEEAFSLVPRLVSILSRNWLKCTMIMNSISHIHCSFLKLSIVRAVFGIARGIEDDINHAYLSCYMI